MDFILGQEGGEETAAMNLAFSREARGDHQRITWQVLGAPILR